MAEFRGNAKGERSSSHPAEENPSMPSRRGISVQPQFQPESRNGGGESSSADGLPSRGFDLQTLDSSFGRLSFSDSAPLHQQIRLPDNRWTNRSPSINGGGGEYRFSPQPSREQMQRFNSRVNGGTFGYYDASPSVMPPNNGGFMNVPYSPGRRFYDRDSTDGGGGGGYGSPRINNYPWGSNMNYQSEPSSPSVFLLAQDQVSCQQLQNNIVGGSKETIDKIFNQVIFHIRELMVDHFGSQLVQKLMQYCSSQQIGQILDMLTQQLSHFVSICNDPLGTRVIQLLLKCLHTEDQILRIVDEISKVALTLAKNNHANHVILQCFRQFTPSQNRSLIVIIAQNCYNIAIDQFGCCMLQECLKIGCNELKHRLVFEIITNALRLCVNSYGNYVVQYVVELDDRDLTEQLIRMLIGNYPFLSRNKYGSHCVQKLLKVKDIDSRMIVNDLLNDIDTLLLDPFGNYVIQTAWVVSQTDMKRMLFLHIHRNIRFMRCNMFGNKILEKLQI